jgi:Tol biopolymer transport system component
LRISKKALICIALMLVSVGQAHAAPGQARLLYASDWSGPTRTYGIAPLRRQPVAQLTPGRPPACGLAACGYGNAAPSPDGRYLLFADWSSCESAAQPASIFLARADGTHRRRLARTARASCFSVLEAAWSPDSRRIAYSVDGEVRIVGTNGRRGMTYYGVRPSWRPRGQGLAYASSERTGLTLWFAKNGFTRMLASRVDDFAWSPTGIWIAYTTRQYTATGERDLAIVRPDGTHRRLLTGYLESPSWSPDSRFLTVSTRDGLVALDIATGGIRTLEFGRVLAWRPKGHQAAMTQTSGVYLVDIASGGNRLLTSDTDPSDAAWSPDGSQLAYVEYPRTGWPFPHADLKLVTVSGRVRTLVRAAGDFGGRMSGLTWTRPPAGIKYRSAPERSVATLSDAELVAPWPVTRIATDGRRVAYTSCGHVFVWTPLAKKVVQVEPVASMTPMCTTPDHYVAFWIYTLALTGDRVAWGQLEGNMGQEWALAVGSAGEAGTVASLGNVGSASGCAVGFGGLGDLTGAGSLLVFSTWRDEPRCPKARTLEQSIHRVGAQGCPCPTIASSPGPLPPFDVEEGRVVSGGDNSTQVLDPDGKLLCLSPCRRSRHSSPARISSCSRGGSCVTTTLGAAHCSTHGRLRMSRAAPNAAVRTAAPRSATGTRG